MPFASIPQAEPVTSRDRRRIAIVVAVIVALIAGAAIWAAVRPGAYGASKDGCITVNLPSTMGGSLVHECGSRARAACADAYAGAGVGPRFFRPQCRLAGIAPPAGAALAR
jgi:hypothetical protein